MLLKFVFLFHFAYSVLSNPTSEPSLENASALQLMKSARGLGDFFTQLETNLMRSYEEEKLTVYHAIELIKSSGLSLTKNADDIRGMSIALSNALTKLTNEMFTKDKVMFTDPMMENKRRHIEARLRDSVKITVSASEKVIAVGQSLNKAGVLLETIIPRYGLLDKVEENNVHLTIKSHMDGVKETLRGSMMLLKEAVDEITTSTKNSARAIIDTAIVLPKFAYFLYDVDEKNMDLQLQGPFTNFKTLVRDTIEYMAVAANKISRSGEGLAEAGWSLGGSVPKFGISILSEQKEIFDRNVIQIFKDLKETFTDITDLFKIAGQKFLDTAKFADESSEALKIAVPKVGRLFYEKKILINQNYQ